MAAVRGVSEKVMKRYLAGVLAFSVFGAGAVAAQSDATATIHYQNTGPRVTLSVFNGEALCDLTPSGRGIGELGRVHRTPTRRGTSFRDAFTREVRNQQLTPGQPVEFVFRRPVSRAAQIGSTSADIIGVRTLLVPQADTEYRARVQHRGGMTLDAVVEARPLGSNAAFTPVPVEQSHAFRDLCVRGAYAMR